MLKVFITLLLTFFLENQIGHSNKDSFLHMVRSATNGNGCDLVISDSKTSLREVSTCNNLLLKENITVPTSSNKK